MLFYVIFCLLFISCVNNQPSQINISETNSVNQETNKDLIVSEITFPNQLQTTTSPDKNRDKSNGKTRWTIHGDILESNFVSGFVLEQNENIQIIRYLIPSEMMHPMRGKYELQNVTIEKNISSEYLVYPLVKIYYEVSDNYIDKISKWGNRDYPVDLYLRNTDSGPAYTWVIGYDATKRSGMTVTSIYSDKIEVLTDVLDNNVAQKYIGIFTVNPENVVVFDNRSIGGYSFASDVLSIKQEADINSEEIGNIDMFNFSNYMNENSNDGIFEIVGFQKLEIENLANDSWFEVNYKSMRGWIFYNARIYTSIQNIFNGFADP